jgi:hypothetical protein
MDLLLDVNIVLDICQPRPAFVQPALQALSRGRREGDRVWLYAGSVQTLEYNLVKGLLDEARLPSQTLPRPEAHRRARQLLKTFAADQQWLAALAGEGAAFDSDDPEDEPRLRALARLGPDARLLSRDGPLAERYPERERVADALKAHGIPTAVYDPKCLHEQPVFEPLGYRWGDFPEAERASREVLSLPMHPGLTERGQDRVVSGIRTAVG